MKAPVTVIKQSMSNKNELAGQVAASLSMAKQLICGEEDEDFPMTDKEFYSGLEGEHKRYHRQRWPLRRYVDGVRTSEMLQMSPATFYATELKKI